MSRQKLFEAIINVTGFTPLESDMDEIQTAVLSELNLPNDDNMQKEEILEHNKIYYLDYGRNTQIIGRYKSADNGQYLFYDLLHYWNGYERFTKNDYCVKNGLENIRRASKSEIHNLLKHEIDNDLL